jgi:hypothetical protein
MDQRPEPTVSRRTLARAIEIAGSDRKLATFLQLELADIRSWASGTATPPTNVFLALMDIVAANALTPAALRTLKSGRPDGASPKTG